jgi:YVTN family beta-propeller protein
MRPAAKLPGPATNQGQYNRESTSVHFKPLCPIVAAALLICALQVGAQETPYLHAPAVLEYALHNPAGTTILPDGRLLRPVGKHIPLAMWPHGLAMTRDGTTLFIASEGVGQIVRNWAGGAPQVTELSPGKTVDGNGKAKALSSAGGAVFSPDGATLYWSGGENGKLYVFDVETSRKLAEIDLNVASGGRGYSDSFAVDVRAGADGKAIYCADVTNFRVVVVDAAARKVVGSVSVGRYPYALAVAGSRVYVANVGMFEYSRVPRLAASGFDPRGLTFPPFAIPSRAARDGVRFEGRDIPGLGDPNAPESFSVWAIDATNAAHPVVVDKIKTGRLVGAASSAGPTVGGSAPNYLLPVGGSLYVCNNNNDSVTRVSLPGGSVAATTRVSPSPLTANLRGLSLSGMAASPDGRRIYIAEAGLNAIAVLDTATGRIVGHIPTPWYPYRLAVSPDGRKLACISFRGFGNGPNAGSNVPTDGFVGMKGALSVIDAPADAELPRLTRTVLENTGLVDRRADRAALASPLVPSTPGKRSPQIKYVLFITKENHTYDTIFDRVPGANGDPSLLRWGYHQRISNPGQPTLDDAAVMTNHNALARQFTVSDNFYMEPEASGVGHRWLVGVQPNNFCQMTYTLGWDFSASSSAPGRRASFGSNGSIAPEDYPEAGSMWDHLARHGVRFRNYGEGFEFAGVGEDDNEGRTGAREVVNIPMSKPLYDNTCRDYPIFNMNIPDVFRAAWFAEDFTRLFLSAAGRESSPGAVSPGAGLRAAARGKSKPGRAAPRPAEMPAFVNIAICNDHGTGPNPAKGYPYRASWMADNDLALGRIVEFLSHTPYWKNMAIFVTQDDAGGEPDHVDAQRSVLLAISPWIKRGYVSHRHTTILSMHRTLYEILGLPPLNLQDAIANDFSDCFTTTPDYRPYTATPVDARIFDPAKTKDRADPGFKRARLAPSIRRDDPAEVGRGAAAGEQE